MAKPNPAVILVDVSGSVGMPGQEGVRHPGSNQTPGLRYKVPPKELPGRLQGHGWLYEAALVRDLMHTLEQTGADIHVYEFGQHAKLVVPKHGPGNRQATYVSPLSGYDYVPIGNQSATNPDAGVELAKTKVKGPVDLFVITDGHFNHRGLDAAIGDWASKVTILQFNAFGQGVERYQIFPKQYGWEVKHYAAETKKQSRSKVQGVVNPRGVTAIYGTPIDFKALPEKITIGRRVANGKFKLEAHYPAKHFNDKQAYIDKRKEGSYCRFYDKKSPFFIARTVWDATSQPGMHMIVKNRGETHRFIVTPKVDDPTKASVIGSYLVHRDNGDPVLCSGVIGELEAAGDDGDFKVTPYQNHGIRCPKFDDQKKELAGHIPQTFEYKKSTKPRGPRKTAADYCKPTHTFKHPTDIKKAEMIADMDDEMDDAVSCLKCSWDGSYEDLVFVDADGGGGYDFHLACPICEEDEWLDDMMAEGVDEPCFSCDGIGHWDDGDCGYCEGSGLMSDTLRAEMAMFNNEYFDADCGCFKKAEGKTLSFMDWAKQEEASHLKKYGAETDMVEVPIKVVAVKDGDWNEYDGKMHIWPDDSWGEYDWEEAIRGSIEAGSYEILDLGEEDWDELDVTWVGHPAWESLKHSYDAEDWVRPKKDAELCPNFDTAKGPLSGPCWDCEVCTKNGMTQEKLQALIDTGWFHKDGTPKADKDGTALLMIEPGEPYVKSGLPAHPRGSGLLGHGPSDYNLSQYGADTERRIHYSFSHTKSDCMRCYRAIMAKHPTWEAKYDGMVADFVQGEFSPNFDDYCDEVMDELEERIDMNAETFEAPYAGAGALMGIKGDSALSSFTPSELTESSAIHGDFDQASLNYSGHQNLEVRAETLGKDSCCCGATKSKPCACMKTGAKCSGSCACSTKEAEYNRPTPKWAKPLGLIGGLAAGYISAQMIDNAKE